MNEIMTRLRSLRYNVQALRAWSALCRTLPSRALTRTQLTFLDVILNMSPQAPDSDGSLARCIQARLRD